MDVGRGGGNWQVEVTETKYFMLLVLMVQLTECNRSVIDGRPFTLRVKPSSIDHSEFEQMLCLYWVTLTHTFSHH